MQKNNFMKSLLALMMVLAMSMSMSSCQGFVDAVFGSEDNPVEKPETTEETESSTEVKANGTTITIASGDEIEDALTEAQAKQMIEAIKASAAKNEEYTITIMSEDPLDAANFGFEVPSIAKANINLVFDCDLVTSEDSPLVIDSESKSKTSTDAINELTITLPDGADDVYLSLTTPETSVTVEGKVTIHYLEALTATSTLYVESGVTIEEILIKGGVVVVKDGGVIETYVYNGREDWDGIKHIDIDYDKEIASYVGVRPIWVMVNDTEGRPEIMSGEVSDKPYFTKYLKVIDVTADDDVEINWNSGNFPEGKSLEKMTISDATVKSWGLYAKNVIGEGTAKYTFYFGGIWNSWNEDQETHNWIEIYRTSVGLEGAEEISNIIFTAPEYNGKEELESDYYTYLDINSLPTKLENCTFQFDNVHFGNNDVSPIVSGSVVKGCKFERSKTDIDRGVYIHVPFQTKDEFGITFENCSFTKGTKFSPEVEGRKYDHSVQGYTYTYYDQHQPEQWVESLDKVPAEIQDETEGNYWKEDKWEEVEYDNYTVIIGLENCTLGGSAITSESDIVPYKNTWGVPNGVKIRFVIDGTTYKFVWDDEDEKYIFVKV